MKVIKLMLEQDHFVNITHLFYSGDYSEGLKEISQILRSESNNSNLYVNRALFLSQLGNDEEAIRDIEKAIKINPRNYIAYFNLFSILTKLVEDEEALSALCCSLSCLYLIRGKLTKSLEDVDKSICYCLNNSEAHVLKGLLLMQKQKYEQSMKSFQNALSVDSGNQIITNLERIAAEKGHITHKILPEKGNKGVVDHRLRCSFRLVDGVEPFDQIQQKLAQFNKLYVDINENAGAITQKVPKDSILSPQDAPTRSRHQQIKIIYDSGLSTPKRQSEVHPQPGAVYIKSSILHEEEKKQRHEYMQNDCFQEENFISIINHEQKIEREECLFEVQGKNVSEIQQEFISVLNIDHPFQEMHEPFESVLCESKHTDPPLQLKQAQAFQQSQPIQHYNLVYPVDDHMKIKITILSLQFVGKDQEYLSKLTDIYCILNYNAGQSKLKTNCKGLQGELCSWNQQFEPIDISQSPSDMKIKVYNKKYTSFRDDFLGDLEVLITTADLLKLPLYNKSGILGNLLMHLQLVEVTPAPIPEPDPQSEEECL